jgi:hypothetical protein
MLDSLKRKLPWIGRLYRQRDALVAMLHTKGLVDFSPELAPAFEKFLKLLKPRAAVGARKVRIGADSDGGYVMLDDFGGVETALSIGIGEDVSWDLAMAERGLRVLQFDPTVAGPPVPHPLFEFHRLGLEDRPREGLSEDLEMVLARVRGPVIGKIDIEGAEWSVLASAQPRELSRFTQLAVEFHQTGRFVEAAWRTRAIAALENLNAHLQCVHVHGNNCMPVDLVAGIPFPSVFEATFVARHGHEFVDDPAVYPTELDRPNDKSRADIYLGRWG